MDITPMIYGILGISVELVFLLVLIVLGIILIKEKNILRLNRRNLILFLALFIFLSCMPILGVSFIHDSSLLGIIEKEISGYPGFDSSFVSLYRVYLIVFTSLLLIISYILSCLSIFVYDKFRAKKQ